MKDHYSREHHSIESGRSRDPAKIFKLSTKEDTMNSGRTKDTTTASPQRQHKAKQRKGYNNTKGRTWRCKPNKEQVPLNPKRKGKTKCQAVRQPTSGNPKAGAEVPRVGAALRRGTPAAARRVYRPLASGGPQPAARVRRQPRTYKGSAARPGPAQQGWKGLLEGSPREARRRGRAGATWSAAGRTRPGSAAWRNLGRGQAAVLAQRSARPRPACAWGTRPGRHEGPGRHHVPGRGEGSQGGRGVPARHSRSPCPAH